MNSHRALQAVSCLYLISAPICAQKMQAFTESLTRQAANFSHFDGKRASYCSLDYGSPKWRAEHGQVLDKLRGSRIRFGKDSWAHLEINTPATLAGKSILPGYYCLAFDLSEEGEWSLVLLEAEQMRKLSLHAFGTARIVGVGELYPLEKRKMEKSTMDFNVSFHPDEEDPAKAELRINFGPYMLSAIMQVDLEQAAEIVFPSPKRKG